MNRLKLCLFCRKRPVAEMLEDERGEIATVGIFVCFECSNREHAFGCNDIKPHNAPQDCTRRSFRARQA